MKIKLVLTDIDGVWTDGGLFFSEKRELLKRFSVYDGWGVRYCRELGIPVGIITAEDLEIAKRIGEKFKVPHIFLGVKDKLAIAKKLCEQLEISLNNVAYIGDDLNDLPLLKAVGYSACPPNASFYVRKEVSYVCSTHGGEGAFREFVEHLLVNEPAFNELVRMYSTYGRAKR